jgi:hypothetical protein
MPTALCHTANSDKVLKKLKTGALFFFLLLKSVVFFHERNVWPTRKWDTPIIFTYPIIKPPEECLQISCNQKPYNLHLTFHPVSFPGSKHDCKMFYDEETIIIIIIFESTFPAIRHTRVSTKKKNSRRAYCGVDKYEDDRLSGRVYFTAHLHLTHKELAFIN